MATATMTAKSAASRDAIHRALPGSKGNTWATAQAVADATGLKYSTTTEYLRAMLAEGRVESTKAARVTVYRKVGASPRLKAGDVPTPRAAVHDAPTSRRDAAVPMITAEHHYPTDDVEARLQSSAVGDEVDAFLANPASGEIRESPAGELVWMATRRAGLHYHHPAKELAGSTVCGRSMRAGVTMPLAEIPKDSTICRECGAAELARAEVDGEVATESAADTPEPLAVPQPPPAANTPTGDDVGAVVDFLESVRPVSAAPAEPEKNVRRARAAGALKTYAVFARGALQAAILSHVQALPAGTDATPYQVAVALNAYPGAVAYGLGRLVVKGNVRLTSEKPQRYAAV